MYCCEAAPVVFCVLRGWRLPVVELGDVSVITCSLHVLFFFFQAEDGIRDLYVTGVQTCALPILSGRGADTQPPGRGARGCARARRARASTAAAQLSHRGRRNDGDRAGAGTRRTRSEERRVGKECRSRWATYQ